MAIQLFVPTFATDEILEEIRECLEKGWTGLGFKTVEIEAKWNEYTGHAHSHFLNSATSGLHLAINIFKEIDDWNDGDEILTTPLTFVSSNHAILYERLKPVFVDIDQYLCLDPQDLERKISDRTRAVLFVGMGGNTGQLEAIKAICVERGLRLILDAAHMSGTRLNGITPAGDATVYSFQAVKTMPTADAGMICFKDEKLDSIARKKAWLGINKDTFSRSSDKGSYKWHYDVEYVGFKYHGSSIMASMALVQLKYLDRDNAYRRQICSWYERGFSNSEVRSIPIAPGCESSRHLYQIEVDNRDELMLALNGAEIYPGVHYRDNRHYQMFAEKEDSCPRSTFISERLISLPLHMRLTKSDVDEVVRNVIKYARV
ncbi:DegT/DnrJ/EryC1/StrS family aminotransferase [Methylorubrum extorquens]|uniref:DegT/DnrJ/EryC1/StrS family aminotransferase n=1 Tax=Methylorubrum extorquens TaxID=408 RepID=UPI0022372816|nr:aminotransferase class I/II-fold pyridoxal phosphate-dependent enzyme [Methylorubrum extorquens]UYW30151.1 aminotransferase class I/II-fold pyridoxal phosphate-dependent enzyme [Methylorubrum extorquens]